MKRCPTCDKTFPDGMRFCQTDGAVLVDDAPAADPYKTVVSNQSEISAPLADPFKTMVAGSSPVAKDDDDILQLPDESDAMKTMMVPRDDFKSGEAEDAPKLDLPPPSPYNPSAPLIEPSPSPLSFSDSNRESSSPKPQGTNPNDATAVMDSSSFQEKAAPPFDSNSFQNDFSQQSPYGNQDNKPIPSPFDKSMPPSYTPPSAPPFDAPKPSVFKEDETPFGGYQESANPSPFQTPSPFGQAEPFNQPMQQTEWTPPPAPGSEWQSQNLGANQSFQPSAGGQGQNQTLAIVSLVCGIFGLCCGVLGIVALITGYMAKNNVDANPAEYGGRGLALAGMILGGISVVLMIVGLLVNFLGLLVR